MKVRSSFENLDGFHPTKNAGFTLVELLVTMGIVGIVIGSITLMFTSMSRQSTTQNATAELQQSVRNALNLMTREIRMAGFAVINNDFGITQAQSSSISFTVDWDNDGDVTSSHAGNPSISHVSDKIQYNWVPTERSLRRVTASGTPFFSSQILLGGADDAINVTGLTFSYLDELNNNTSFLDDIWTVVVTLTAETPAGRDGMVQRTFVSRVGCRNLGL